MVHHRGRRSIRLPGFDYTQPGAYFVTICTYSRQDLFGEVTHGEVTLSEAGRIAARGWKRIPSFFPNITLDAWVVMPNHLHGIIIMGGRGEALEDLDAPAPTVPTPSASPLPSPARGTRPESLASTIQNYKSVTARRINRMRRTPSAPVWQRNYYEHVLRAERDLERIREYILANPAEWRNDRRNCPTL